MLTACGEGRRGWVPASCRRCDSGRFLGRRPPPHKVTFPSPQGQEGAGTKVPLSLLDPLGPAGSEICLGRHCPRITAEPPSHPSWRRRGGWGAPRGPRGGNMKCDFPHTREPEPAWVQLISFLSPLFVLGKIKAHSPSALFKRSRSKLAAAGAGGLLRGAEGSARSSPPLCPPLLARAPMASDCVRGPRLRPAVHPPVSLHPALEARLHGVHPPLRTTWFPGLSLSPPLRGPLLCSGLLLAGSSLLTLVSSSGACRQRGLGWTEELSLPSSDSCSFSFFPPIPGPLVLGPRPRLPSPTPRRLRVPRSSASIVG